MTAVDYLKEQILDINPKVYNLLKEIDAFNYAKEMEKQQIINAVDGFPLKNRNMLGEQYYKETYERKNY